MTQALVAMNSKISMNDFHADDTNDVHGAKVRVHQLNRTQRPRLINMRLLRKERRSLRNFLTVLLEKNSPLYRERITRKKAMVHWFMRGQENYDNQVIVEKTALHGAIIDSLARSRVDDVLKEVESQTQSSSFYRLIGLTA